MANVNKFVDYVQKLERCKRLVGKWRNMASKMSTGDVARFRLRQCADELEQALEPAKGSKSQERR